MMFHRRERPDRKETATLEYLENKDCKGLHDSYSRLIKLRNDNPELFTSTSHPHGKSVQATGDKEDSSLYLPQPSTC